MSGIVRANNAGQSGAVSNIETIDSDDYVDDSIDTAHIAVNQVTLAEMAGITRGSIIYGDASGDPAALAKGTEDYVLTAGADDVAWAAASAGASLSGSTNNTVATVTGSNALIGETNLTFDGTHLTVGSGSIIIGTSGQGIDFSAATPDESGAGGVSGEVLADYEEGSWTPVLVDSSRGDGASESQGYSGQLGRYIKIGTFVHIQFHLEMNSIGSLTAGSVAYFGGLPFTPATQSNMIHSINCFASGLNSTAGYGGGISVNSNDTFLAITTNDAATGGTSMLISEVSASGNFWGTIGYRV